MYKLADEDSYSLGSAVLVHHSDLAVLVETDEGETWIPKSVIHDDSEVYHYIDVNGVEHENERGELFVKHWWAKKQGYAE